MIATGQRTAARSLDEITHIRKAFEANPGETDIGNLVDGAALSMQFIDHTMVAMVAGDSDFQFLHESPRVDVTQVLAEYNKYSSHGDSPYRSSYLGQSAEPAFQDAILQRMYDEVAFLAEGFEYNRVIAQVQNINDPETVQANAALNRMLISLSRNIFHGDKSTLPIESTGFIKKVSDLGSDFVYDCRGTLPSADVIKEFSARIRTKYFGVVNKFILPHGTKNLVDASFTGNNQYVIQNAQMNPSGVKQGNIISGVLSGQALNGEVVYQPDLWIDDSYFDVPKVWDAASRTYVEGAVGENPPAMPSIAAAANAPAVPGSLFDAPYAGATEYRVAAQSDTGTSQASLADSATVAANGSVTITITPGVGGVPAQRFIIFRETTPGSGVFRKIAVIANSGNPTTVFTDLNEQLPGFAWGVMGDFNSRSTTDQHRTFRIAELMKPLKTTFPEGVRHLRMNVGMIEYYCVNQILAPEKFVVFRNLPVQES